MRATCAHSDEQLRTIEQLEESVAAVYTLAAVAAERRFPMKNVAEAIGVRAHFSWHTFAVPHPAHSSEHPNTVTYFCRPHALMDYETFEHVTADVPHFIDEVYNTPLRAVHSTVGANCASDVLNVTV